MGRITAIMKLAAEAEVDLRTAKKAYERGAAAVRGRVGERIAAAAARLGVTLGGGHDAGR